MAKVQRTRMMWYYSAIIDWMIANPGKPLYECAAYIGRTQATLSVIINSDMFKAALAQRKQEFQMQHDFGIIEKTTKIANASLDSILATLERKKDTIPLETLKEISESALTRLGYGAQPTPGVALTVNNTTQTNNVVVPVTVADLEEARMALRMVQEQGRQALPPASPPLELEAVVNKEAESVPRVEDVRDAPASNDS